MPSFPSSETRPLPIWAAERDQVDLAPIRKAKEALGLPFKVVPWWVPAPDGRAGIPDFRVLALGTRPPWICDYALVNGRGGDAGLQAALAWVLGDHEHPRATTVLDILSATFGPGVREISPEELEAEEKFRLYLTRQD